MHHLIRRDVVYSEADRLGRLKPASGPEVPVRMILLPLKHHCSHQRGWFVVQTEAVCHPLELTVQLGQAGVLLRVRIWLNGVQAPREFGQPSLD